MLFDRTEEVDDAADRGADEGFAQRHRLDDHERSSLVTRRKGDDVERRVDLVGGTNARESDFARLRLEAPAILSVSVDHETSEASAERCDPKEQIVILDRSHASDDPDDDLVRLDAQLRTQRCTRRLIIAQSGQVDAQRHDHELPRTSDAVRAMDLLELLPAEHDDAVAVDPRQEPLERNEEPRLPGSLVTPEDVSVVRVNETSTARTSDEQRRGHEAVEEACDAARRSGLRGVRVHDVGSELHHDAPDLPERDQVPW